MRRFFWQKSEEELAVNALKRLRKKLLREKGGVGGVCVRFIEFTNQNEMYLDSGLVVAEEAPYSKIEVSLAALDVLSACKDAEPNLDPQQKEMLEKLSKQAYISSQMMLGTNEMVELYESIGGKPGQFESNPEQAKAASANLKATVQTMRETAENAWLKWTKAEFDVFDAIRDA